MRPLELAGNRPRWVLGLLAVAITVLIFFGALTTHRFFQAGRDSWLGVTAASGIVIAYGALGIFWVAPGRMHPAVMQWVTPLGLIAGAIYAAEIGLEYIVRPADNTLWGLAEFSVVFACFVVAGAGVAIRARRFWIAAAAGAWTAVLSVMIWYAVVLAMFYVFHGTAAQDAVFQAEGDLEDFRRSGMSDFDIFAMQDFLGAGLYHALLNPLFGLVLGMVGATPVIVSQRWRARRRRGE